MDTGRPIRSSRVWPVAVAALTILVLLSLVTGAEDPAAGLVVVLVIAGLATFGAAWALHRSRRQRQAYEDRLATWAGERAAQAERLRIARDLHDLVSHGLGLITVRASAAVRVTGPGGETERANALADIENVSRETTAELRRMLSVLRTPNADPAPVAPPETLEDLPTIAETARDTGLRVILDLPELGDVSSGTQLTVCAIVREALSNTARHAGPTRVHVGVHREDAAIVTTVRDEGPVDGWQGRPGAGHGLTGLRERVTALSGTMSAGAGRGGFVITARIPDPGAT